MSTKSRISRIRPLSMSRLLAASVAIVAVALVAGTVSVLPWAQPAAAATSSMSGASKTITVTPLPWGNPRFVDAVYKDLLGRTSETGGRNYWVGRMAKGLTRGQLSQQVAKSPEWRQSVVTRLFNSSIGRAPTATELSAYTARMARGERVADLAASLFGSNTFYSRAGGNPTGFARLLYRTVVGRDPTGAEVSKVVADLAAKRTRASVARAVFLSLEANGQRVDALYALLLARRTESGGRDYWARQLMTKDDTVVAAVLVGSDEYFNRAQKRVAAGTFEQPATTEIIPPASVVAVTGGGTANGTATVAASVPADVGDVVVIQPGTVSRDGLMGKVTAKTIDSSGHTVLSTIPAAWTEAFTSANFTGIIDVPVNPIAPTPVAAAPSASGMAAPTCLGGISLLPAFSASFDTQFQWGPFQDHILRFVASAHVGIGAEVNLTGGLGCSVSFPFFEAPVVIGPVAILVIGELGVSVEPHTNTTFFASADLFCSVGAELRNGTITDLTDCDKNFAAGIHDGTATEGSASVSASASISASAYGVLGLSGSIGPVITLATSSCGTPWWVFKAKLRQGMSVTLNLWIATASLEIGEHSFGEVEIAHGGTSEACSGWTGTAKVTTALTNTIPVPNGSEGTLIQRETSNWVITASLPSGLNPQTFTWAGSEAAERDEIKTCGSFHGYVTETSVRGGSYTADRNLNLNWLPATVDTPAHWEGFSPWDTGYGRGAGDPDPYLPGTNKANTLWTQIPGSEECHLVTTNGVATWAGYQGGLGDVTACLLLPHPGHLGLMYNIPPGLGDTIRGTETLSAAQLTELGCWNALNGSLTGSATITLDFTKIASP